MIKSFDFYFDFGSPYTFLAHKEIRKIENENSIKINYMPILLGGLLKHTGMKANADIPTKAKYMIKDCKLWAEKKKIKFKFNDFFPIQTLKLMRCVLVSEKKNFSQIFIDKIFSAIWVDGLNLNDETILKKILNTLDVVPDIFLSEAESIDIKNKLKEKTEEAFQKGIFGSPSFVINNKIFWGQDRLEFVMSEAKK
jgi:2-hydroxychromene-2-carboxylate isomerase